MRPFGDLEAVVMDVLWRRAAATTVREVLAELTPSRPLAYTTVMTVMDNLHRKGALSREMEGRAWRYRATRSRAEHSAAMLQDVLSAAGDRDEVLMHFVADLDADAVASLRTAVEAARQAQSS
ncbi:BlaI/MecI/CopY family transcriptional regulator [Modestobacter sp. VKM Ac-2984]|uniref:BlaI/MecI/CopY family transcriptional regulator n=1 Tax=Modestobacter sp. VKM Ac-2984 TaxID=3004138 RepID=UPI0022AA06E4|nr:BlaI/MecI/CopY family transcriptional regulator [Modestobacter sp. VKM Ac-2984]MCZ2818000.1 BlaI/MecI/CopY family transcriptional regulator [Modestobacter sp. VKM Ac-2984]